MKQEIQEDHVLEAQNVEAAAEAACLFLRDAFEGQARVHPLPGEQHMRWYKRHLMLALSLRVNIKKLHIDFQLLSLLRIAVLLPIFLCFFERPFWCTNPGTTNSTHDPHWRCEAGPAGGDKFYLTYGLPYLP